jgi:hypothetical protein
MDHALAHEIERLCDEFLAVVSDPRPLTAFMRLGYGETLAPEDLELVERMQTAMRMTIDRLRPILEEHGWPGRWPVGVHQHVGGMALLHGVLFQAPIEFKRVCLEQVREAFEIGSAKASDLALLTDMVLLAEGRPQRYGMVATRWPEVAQEPIEDAERMDERRAALGLGPLAEHVQQQRASAEMHERQYGELREQHP